MEELVAHLKLKIDFTENFYHSFSENERHEIKNFFSLHGQEINEKFIEIAREQIKEQYKNIIPQERVGFPIVRIIDSQKGSWYITATIVTYTVSEAISKFPQIHDGISELKRRITKNFNKVIEKFTHDKIKDSSITFPSNKDRITSVNLDVVKEKKKIPIKSEKTAINYFYKVLILANTLGIITLFVLHFYYNDKTITYNTQDEVQNKKIDSLSRKILKLEKIKTKELEIIKKANQVIEELQNK